MSRLDCPSIDPTTRQGRRRRQQFLAFVVIVVGRKLDGTDTGLGLVGGEQCRGRLVSPQPPYHGMDDEAHGPE